ncbi:hypothetical protein L1987_20429 [Smallanthus sonchifolius]|uniref:Uncharacterized protein n=1 Tax=Smallanthus sonchifolius TaxID=185202 RepID=A0ACB9IUP7_9ASTR|nr:hypothetical protein L1987_20429 [Smallanthus sonchifolius]
MSCEEWLGSYLQEERMVSEFIYQLNMPSFVFLSLLALHIASHCLQMYRTAPVGYLSYTVETLKHDVYGILLRSLRGCFVAWITSTAYSLGV